MLRSFYLIGLPILLLTGVSTAFAHTPFLMVENGTPGNVRIETGFSDGGTGSGMEIILRDKSDGRTLSVHTVPEDGVLEIPMPDAAYTVTFDTGPGHVITKDGPLADTAETGANIKGEYVFIGIDGGDPGKLGDAVVELIQGADVVLCYQRAADRLKTLLGQVDPTIAPDDVWMAFGLNQHVENLSGDDVQRFNRALEIRAAVEKVVRDSVADGKTVVILVEGQIDTSPDWAWLVEALQDLEIK